MKDKGYKIKEYHYPVKRYCQTMDLKNNPDLIAMYKKCHSQAEAWPEIREGIRSVGILEMEIYIAGSRLFMIVETPLDFDWETAMNKLSHLPDKQNGKIMYPDSKSVAQKVLRLKNGN